MDVQLHCFLLIWVVVLPVDGGIHSVMDDPYSLGRDYSVFPRNLYVTIEILPLLSMSAPVSIESLPVDAERPIRNSVWGSLFPTSKGGFQTVLLYCKNHPYPPILIESLILLLSLLRMQ